MDFKYELEITFWSCSSNIAKGIEPLMTENGVKEITISL